MIAVVWSSVRGQEREWSQTETMSDFFDGYHTVHSKKSEDQLAQESGSIGWAGLKIYMTFHRLHALLM